MECRLVPTRAGSSRRTVMVVSAGPIRPTLSPAARRTPRSTTAGQCRRRVMRARTDESVLAELLAELVDVRAEERHPILRQAPRGVGMQTRRDREELLEDV